ncbi:transient receptor potential cation channel subfamily M member-like 2 [Glandiceps talaboti]
MADTLNGDLIKMKKVAPLGTRRRRTSGSGSSINIRLDESSPSWLHTNFRMRECIRFTEVKDMKSAEPMCQCGKTSSLHDDRYLHNPDPSTPWKESTHTQTTNTNAYGDIEFVGSSTKPAKFIRLDHETPTRKILQLLKEQWHLGTPNLLISVTGGAKDFNMTSRLKGVFRKGLTKVALSTNAWIITGGTHAGVMKHVGEAVRDYTLGSGSFGNKSIVNIGIAPWGVTHNREELISVMGKYPAFYRVEEPEGMAASLDPNHTHFILVDNGTNKRFGTEIKLRGKIEKAISEMRLDRSKSDIMTVPVVCVVLEGGPGTIQTVWSAITNGTPSVVVAGSGRAADLLAWAVLNVPEKDIPIKDRQGKIIIQKRAVINATFEAKLTSEMEKEFGTRNLDTMVGWVKDCLRRKDLITVFELDAKGSAKDIDLAILQALLKANKGRVQDQLKLALAWNRIDIAKSEIFTDDRKWKQGDLDEALHIALTNNQVDFVRLFLETGESLWEFLTVKRLTRLYNEIRPNTLLYDLLHKIRSEDKKSSFRTKFTLEDVGHLMEDLTDDTYEPLYLDKKDPDRYKLTEEEEMGIGNGRWAESTAMASLTGAGNSIMEVDFATTASVADLHAVPPPNPVAIRERRFDNPVRELFLWSVLMNQHEMAELFWEDGSDAMAAALAASQIMKSLAAEEDGIDSFNDFEVKAKEYEEMACGVLTECYKDDEERAQLLLVRELPFWGNSTCLRLGISADDKNYIAHAAAQNLLSIIWYGKLDRQHTTTARLLCCLVFPPFLYCLLKFREPEQDVVEDYIVKTKSKKDGDKLNQSLNMIELQQEKGGSKANLIDSDDPTYDNSVEFVEYEEGIDIRARRKLQNYEKWKYFFNAPVVSFCYNVFSYIVFLALFSYIMLISFNKEMSSAEIVLTVWATTLVFEEIRQIMQEETKSLRLKLSNWLSDYWNILDMVCLLTFYTGLTLRLLDSDSLIQIARYMWSIDVMLYYIRFLHVFYINRQMGPKLIMIGKMMVDLLFFVGILFIIMLGYGVSMQAILYPNESRVVPLIEGIFYKPYFQIYGELFLEEVRGEIDCTTNATLIAQGGQRCPDAHWLVLVLLVLYMMLSNVLLLNLLIAMFSYTFEAVQENTDIFWKFQRYGLIVEYMRRPPLVPPLIVISHIWIAFRAILRNCCCRVRSGYFAVKVVRPLKQNLTVDEHKQLSLFEMINTEKYVQDKESLDLANTDERIRVTHQKVDAIVHFMDQWKDEPEEEEGVEGASGSAAGGGGGGGAPINRRLDGRMKKLEVQMDRTQQALDWIIKAMIENKMGAKSGPPKLKEIKGKDETIDYEDLSDDDDDTFKVATSIEELGLMLHYKSRLNPYPGSVIQRFKVPDHLVHWEIEFSNYSPMNYTASVVLSNPVWADEDILAMPKDTRPPLYYNQMDNQCQVSRISYTGVYTVKDGLPLNPKGRTGMIGRGLLGRFGPNHAADPIVTRWKKKFDGSCLEEDGKKVLEFVAIQRKDNQQWAIPGGMVEPGQLVSQTLKAEFSEEALGKLAKSEAEIKEISERLDKFFQNGIEVYKGYVDDPRNTDNAWMETVAVNYHDETNETLGHFKLQAGDDAQAVRWQRISGKMPLYASHTAMLKRVAQIHDANY